MEVRLDGKVIVITGAAQGIGAGIAAMAREAGAEVFGTDRAGFQGGFVADLMDTEAPEAIAAAAIARFGRIDGLVNAAGLTTRAGFEDATPDAWESLFAVNARAPFFLMQTVIGHLKGRAAPGSVVNIQSMNAHCGAPDLSVYSATKGALQTLTKNAANAFMADRIRVNGINLGWVATQSEDRMQSVTLGKGPNWQAEAAARLPLGRLVAVEEAARMAVYLLSDASAPMTGVSLDLEQTVVGAP